MDSRVSKLHCQGKLSKRIFIYDNEGTVRVYIGTLEKKDCRESRDEEEQKRFVISLNVPDRRQNPTLFALEKEISCTILLVIGGYELNLKNKKEPYDDIYVYKVVFEETCHIMPFLKIKMILKRNQPLVFKNKLHFASNNNGNYQPQVYLLKLNWRSNTLFIINYLLFIIYYL